MLYKSIIWLSGVFLLIACHGGKVSNVSGTDEPYQEVAFEKYGFQAECLKSPAGDRVLCLQKNNPEVIEPSARLVFFVYDLHSNAILQEFDLRASKVAWETNDLIRVWQALGIAPKQGDGSYLYNVVTKRKVNQKNEKKQ